MNNKGFFLGWTLVTILMVFAICGCQSTPPPASSPLSCEEQLEEGITDLSDSEIAKLLDGAKQDSKFEDCWEPLIKKCLDSNKSIPHDHLKLAVKAFNKYKYEAHFQKATARYFNDVIFNDLEYRAQDREFLKAYVRYILKSCSSKDCPPLETAKQLCKRLDPDLYSKFFETS